MSEQKPMTTGEVLIWILVWVFLLYPIGFLIITLIVGFLAGIAPGLGVIGMLLYPAYLLFPLVYGLQRARAK